MGRSALVEIQSKTVRFNHFFDLHTGRQVANAEVVAALMDLTTRQIVPLADDELILLNAHRKTLQE